MGYSVDYGGKTYDFQDEQGAKSFLDHIASTQTQQSSSNDSSDLINKVLEQNKQITATANQAQSDSSAGNKIKNGLISAALGPLGVVAKDVINGPQTKTDLNPVTAGILNAANTAAFNKFPELEALAKSTLGGQDYNQALNQSRDLVNQAKTAYPGTSDLSSVVGNYFNPINKLAGGMSPNAGLASRLMTGAGTNILAGQAYLPLDANSGQRAGAGLMDLLSSLGFDALHGAAGKIGQFQDFKNALQDGEGTAVSLGDISPLKKTAIPEANLARSELQNQGYNVPILPSEMQTPSGLDTLQNLLENAPFSEKDLKSVGLSERSSLSNIAQDLENQTGLQSRTEKTLIGEVNKLSQPVDEASAVTDLHKAYQGKLDSLEQFMKQSSGDLSSSLKSADNSTVHPANTYDIRDKIVSDISSGGGTTFYSSALNKILDNPFFDNIKTKSGKTAFSINEVTGEAQASRSRTTIQDLFKLNQQINKLYPELGDQQERQYVEFIKDGIKNDLKNIASTGVGPTKQAAADTLLTLSKQSEAQSAVQSDLLSKVSKNLSALDGNPFTTGNSPQYEKATGIITNAIKNNDVAGLQRVEQVLGPKSLDAFRKNEIQNILRGPNKDEWNFDIFGGSRNNPNANPLRKRLNEYDDKTLQFLLGSKEEVSKLRNLGAIAPYLEQATKALKGDKFGITDLATLAPAATGLMAGMAKGDPILAVKGLAVAGGLTAATKILSKWYTHPAIAEMLIRDNKKIVTPSQASFTAKRVLSKALELDSKQKGTYQEPFKVNAE